MSKVFKDYISRLTTEDILKYKEKLDRSFQDKGYYLDSFIPKLYSEKKDHGDLDYFILLNDFGKKEYQKNNKGKPIVFFNNIFKDINLKIVEGLKDNEGNEINTIYKTDLERTMLVYDKIANKLFHLDVTLLDNNTRYKQYYFYYINPFLSYHLGIILRNFGIKYTSKGVYYVLTKEQTGWEEKKVLITKDLELFLELLGYFYNGDILVDFNNINSFKDLINFLYKLSIFHYKMFDFSNLKYEEKRKVRSYETNKKISDIIQHDKIDNFTSFFNIDYNEIIKDKINKLILKQQMLDWLIERSNNKEFKGTDLGTFKDRIIKTLEEQIYKKNFKERKDYIYNKLFPDKKIIGTWFKNKDKTKIDLIKQLNNDIGNFEYNVNDIVKKYENLI